MVAREKRIEKEGAETEKNSIYKMDGLAKKEAEVKKRVKTGIKGTFTPNPPLLSPTRPPLLVTRLELKMLLLCTSQWL